MAAAELLLLLESGDVEGCRAYTRKHAPHQPQPETREDAEIVFHHTRTIVSGLTLGARAYSHAWLRERSLPSGLPDELKPAAERLHPVIVEGVLISVLNANNDMARMAKPLVEADIAEAVADAYARGKTETGYIRGLMADTKARSMRSLFGRGER